MEALKTFFHKTVEFVEITQMVRNELEALAMKKETKQAKAAKKKKK